MPATLQLIRKFQALTNRIDEALAETVGQDHRSRLERFDPLDVLPLFERWIAIRAELVVSEPELADLPQCVPPTSTSVEIVEGVYSAHLIDREPIERMRSHIRDGWDILNHPSRQLPQISIDEAGIFVGGQPFDAMLAITSILRAATKSILLVDGYVAEHNLNLLRVKADAVAAKILTQPQSANPAFVTAARAFVTQYAAGPPVEIRTTAAFHDRFIVIDDTDYYHFGASIKDAAKKNTFMFSRIKEPTIAVTLLATITKEWQTQPLLHCSVGWADDAVPIRS